MERYNFEMRLKSYNVNKQLIQTIADYIDDRISMVLQEEIPKSILLHTTTIYIRHKDEIYSD